MSPVEDTLRSTRDAYPADLVRLVQESVRGVGTRHRSAYRLCNELGDVIAVVFSQDGNVRFVKRKNDAVTYWDQA